MNQARTARPAKSSEPMWQQRVDGDGQERVVRFVELFDDANAVDHHTGSCLAEHPDEGVDVGRVDASEQRAGVCCSKNREPCRSRDGTAKRRPRVETSPADLIELVPSIPSPPSTRTLIRPPLPPGHPSSAITSQPRLRGCRRASCPLRCSPVGATALTPGDSSRDLGRVGLHPLDVGVDHHLDQGLESSLRDASPGPASLWSHRRPDGPPRRAAASAGSSLTWSRQSRPT